MHIRTPRLSLSPGLMADLYPNGKIGRAMKHWTFGVGQTGKQERAEIQAAGAAGLHAEYMARQGWARMVETESERRRASHPNREKQRRAARRQRARAPVEAPEQLLPTPQQIDAARSKNGGWTRPTLSTWGVPWPPPRGWRRALERQRVGRSPRPPGWSGPVITRRIEDPRRRGTHGR